MTRPVNLFIPAAIGLSVVFVVVLIFSFAFKPQSKNTNTTNDVACTMEAKLCPDGSYVGRSGPNCEFAKCPAVNTNVAVNTNSGTNENLNTNATVSETLPAGVKRFTSSKLGITFTYLATSTNGIATPQVIGDKIYVGGTNGQWVQKFAKATTDTLALAIEKQFLADYSTSDCYVVSTTSPIPGWQTAQISFPTSGNTNGPWWENADRCPAGYTTTNGVSYFATDPQHPDRYYYFSIGQYAIYGSNDNMTDWPKTVRSVDE